MRKAPSAVILSILVPLAGAVPVVSLPQAAAKAVSPEVRSVALAGVDRAAERRLAASSRRTFAAATTGRPEVLVTERGVASFDLLGVTWRRTVGDADLLVQVRTHSSRGWSGWTELDDAVAPRPEEARRARPGTEPLWVGGADGYQVRVDVLSGSLPRGLRIDLIDPGAAPADRRPEGRRPLQSAQAAAAAPVIYSRAQWGADERLRRSAPSYSSRITTGFVHHTAGKNNYSQAEVPQILRAVYAYHVKGNGWSDIGYNFLVDRFGRLWEGRYGGMDRAVIGAHTGGFNLDTFAVSAIGNFDRTEAPAVMVDSIARVMAWKLAMNFRDPSGTAVLTSQGGGTSRYGAGTRVTFPNLAGHRDAGKTSCPGSNLYAQLDTIRALTNTYLGTTMFDPRASSSTAVHGTGDSITTTAAVNTEQSWRLEIREVCRGTLVRTLTGAASPATPVSAFWDLRDEGGGEVRPGAYALALVSGDATASTYTWTSTVSVNPTRTSPPPVGESVTPGRTSFVPVDPVRLYDTRAGGNLPLGPKQQLNLAVHGVGKLPSSGIAAVALNVSTSCSSATTNVKVWPAGSRRPSSAALNVPAGTPASALAVTALGGNGEVSLKNRSGTTELAVEVVGYYPVEGGQVFRPTKTLRLYDSRRDAAGPLEPGAVRTVTVPTLSGVAATAMTGALVNVTSSRAAGPGTVTVQSPGSDRSSATVSFVPGRVIKNRAVARLQDGTFTVTGHAARSHVVVDLVGWWAPAEVVRGRLFQPRAVSRVLDTRKGIGVRREKVGAGEVVTVKVAGRGKPVPAGARAVVMTLTARSATANTFVTAWPSGKRRPVYPDLSVPAYRTTANLVVVRIGKKNRVKLTNGSGSTHLVGDVVGYYP